MSRTQGRSCKLHERTPAFYTNPQPINMADKHYKNPETMAARIHVAEHQYWELG